MKHFFLVLGTSLLVASAAHAQLGVRLGGSIAQLHTTEGQVVHSSSSSQPGYQVGITYQLPLTARLSLVPEVQYSNERMKLAQASYATFDIGFTADTRLSLHYLNLPVLVRATFGPLYVEAGPQASLLLGGRQTGSQIISSWGMGPASQEYAIDQPATQGNRRVDAGPCLGVGLTLPAGLGINVRAYQGLVTLNNERSAYDGKFKRQSLQASLTYQLPRH